MDTDSSQCNRCGMDADAVVDGEALCGECFHLAGSCCGSYGEDCSAED